MVNADVLNSTQKNALVGALSGAGQAAASNLTDLLTKQVALTPGEVNGLAPAEVAEKFAGNVVFINLALSGDVSGSGMLMFQESSAAFMADIMIGQDGTNPPENLSDLHLSAIAEAGNQMAASFCEALGESLGKSLTAAPSDLQVAQPGDVPGIAGSLGGECVACEFSMDVEGGPSSPFLLLLDPSAAEALSSAEGAPAPAPKKGAAAPSTAAPGGGFQPTLDYSQAGGGTPMVQPAQMSNIGSVLAANAGNNLELLMDVPLKVTVELGRTHKLVKEVLAIGPGSVLELDKLAGEPVDILVNEKAIAKGEVVVIDENFGIRVTEILNPRERLNF